MPSSSRSTSQAAVSLLSAVLLSVLPLTACSDDGGPTQSSLPIPELPSFDGVRDFADTLTVDGLLRRYWVHLPADYEHERRKSVPMLVVYHGSGEDGEVMKLATGLDTLADANDFVAIYPNAGPGGWATGPDGTPDEGQGLRDVRFTRELIRRLVEEYAVIPTEVFATGFSRGGFFIQFMACLDDSPVKAIATVGTTMAEEVGDRCVLPSNLAPEPLPVLLMHGDQDNSVPAAGREGLLSLQQSVAVLVELDECVGEPTVSFPPPNPSSQTIRIRRILFDRCADNTRVQVDVVEGGGHMWFGALDPSSPFSASEIVVDFFRSAAGL